MKKIVKTEKSPAPIAFYNQGILLNNILFTSGQIALDPKKGEPIQSDIVGETQQVMKNIQGILEGAGMNFDNVVKATIFLSDINDFEDVDLTYGSFFTTENAPAREAVQVACLPKNMKVEISVIAIK